MIATLDNHVHTNFTCIDEVLRVSETCIDSTANIMSLDTYNWCRSCKTLISVAVDLVVKLYELAVFSSNDLPSLYLGAFEIGRDEKFAIYKGIISQRLQQIRPILRRLSSGCGAEVGSGTRKRHVDSFLELEYRVQALVSAIEVPPNP